MLFIKPKKLRSFVLLVLLAAASAFSSTCFAEASESGGGEGAAEGEAAPAAAPGSGADREWAKRQSKLNVQETKIKDLTKQIQDYIKIKNGGHHAPPAGGEAPPQGDVLDSIAKAYKELEKTIGEYNKERDELKYKFPEEGVLIERRYVPLRVQSLDQIERQMGLDGDLLRTKKKIEKTYAPFVGDSLAKPTEKQKNLPEETLKRTKPSGDEPQRLKLSQ